MKKRFIPRIAILAAILFAVTMLALPMASHAQPQKAQFMIVNQSDWDIHGLFLSPTHKDTWGPDQLGDEIIKHGGGSFTIHSIPCGHYDIKVVDEDGDACVIEDVVMCKDHTHWDITNKELANCEGWGN
ncbi:MAG: hypothetical protein QOH63_1696 [Acidobacteriota bacterium]|jgi:hypothetical protein|nr:hypothetical protein [Acidobacteriota bacterium]